MRLENTKIENYATAGKATLTIHNTESDKHFTYEILAPKKKTENGGFKVDHEAPVRFVKVLTGNNNNSDYTFLGTLFKTDNGWIFKHGKKSSITENATSSKAFDWTWKKIATNALPEKVEVLHDGCCGRCGRKLTHPESLHIGLGPECASK